MIGSATNEIKYDLPTDELCHVCRIVFESIIGLRELIYN
jgi:hypothetical protein